MLEETRSRQPPKMPYAVLPVIDDCPAHWGLAQLRDIAILKTGATPSRSESRYFAGDIRWLVSGDINREIIVDCEGRISQAGLDSSNCKILEPDSVLIALNGQGKTRGTVALLRCPAACNQSLVAIEPSDRVGLLPEFLFWYLRAHYRRIRDITGQHDRRGLNMKIVGSFEVPIPPPKEQRRIVARVDELMALLDDFERTRDERDGLRASFRDSALDALQNAEDAKAVQIAWSRIASNLDRCITDPADVAPLRQTILQLAVRGRLVPQDARDEPASELVEAIRRDYHLRKQDPVNEADIPFEIPSSWEWVRYGQITDSRLGKMLDKAKNSGRLRSYLRNTNVQWFRFELADLKELRIRDEELDECTVSDGDIVICEGGEPGRCAVCDETVEGLVYQKALHRCRPLGGISPWYLAYLFKCDTASQRINERFTGATIKHLTGRSLALHTIPLPPLAEQRRIVAKVDELMAICDELEAKLTEARDGQSAFAAAAVHHLDLGG